MATAHEKEATATARKQRRIQADLDRRESGLEPAPDEASQLGARPYPVPPFPKQHQKKPGEEARLEPAPMYDAPYYRGSGKLEGKVALITGGDSGIGRAVAIFFAREGADVAFVYLDEKVDAETTVRAVEAEGRRCLAIAGDVGDRNFCHSAARETVEKLGKLDILVNNAAFQVHAKRFEDLTPEHLEATIRTNLFGYVNMAQAAVRWLEPGSTIINTGSITGIEGSKALIDYSLTKGGIHAFTKALAANLLPRGIRVNAVAPGPVWTPLNPSDRDAEDVATFGSGTPMKRPAQPEEIAPAYVFFASPQCSSFITGEVLPIVGGYG